jgi:hypothetical protein
MPNIRGMVSDGQTISSHLEGPPCAPQPDYAATRGEVSFRPANHSARQLRLTDADGENYGARQTTRAAGRQEKGVRVQILTNTDANQAIGRRMRQDPGKNRGRWRGHASGEKRKEEEQKVPVAISRRALGRGCLRIRSSDRISVLPISAVVR